ncbi:serine protease [Streptomyces sp. ISL-100]|uniref:S1 family peptidase n=1 Tax=Streptomyces sp. ISL-100 TaxID=2819173 RepID=UPI001BE7EA73|nr:serine protease [Streptomyces sp. ISL-100]MBT2395212.1 trypsin-like peptidase domain-containing protein [Streptomyces sp. ISL-100]
MAVRETPLPTVPPLPQVKLVRICDLAGRPRGTGFVADDRGTVVTSHEAVDGLTRVVLHAPGESGDSGERTCLAEADAIVPLPEMDLALVTTQGLGVRPVPVAARDRIETGTYVRLPAGGWREARVLRPLSVTYTATDRFHLIEHAVELAMGTAGTDALRLGSQAAGGPVLDAGTGAVLAVLGTALGAEQRAAGFAVPLRAAAAAAPDGPLAELLRRNAATVPGYGPDLNLAGALQLTATSAGPVGGPERGPGQEPVERPEVAREFASFSALGGALVLALVGDPGTGRTTELAALAARRAQGPEPAPTLWLRGAELRAGDTSVADAVARALQQAGRIVAASGEWSGDPGGATPERVARLALDAGRPLLVLLDGPEEMPPALTHRLPDWTAATASWLRTAGVRMVVACRSEHWEQAGALYPEGALHRPARPARPDRPWPGLPSAVRIEDLTEAQALRARERYGIPDGALADPSDARHPLTLRLLAEVREALPGDVPGRPTREEVFAAHLDLMCLRIAVRLAATARPSPRGTAVRRLAAKVSGQVHEAARRCLGPGQGELDRESFEEIFPWRTGWASAVLTEGLLVPAGGGYRFAHEELADWLQGEHLDIDEALHALVHRAHDPHPPEPTPTPEPAGHIPPPPGAQRGTADGQADAGAGAACGSHGGTCAECVRAPLVPGTYCERHAQVPSRTGSEPAEWQTQTGSGQAGGHVPRPASSHAGCQARVGSGEACVRVPLPAGAPRGVDARVPSPAGSRGEGRWSSVPRHRIGAVVEALLLVERVHGPAALSRRLLALVRALENLPSPSEEASWWGRRLLGEVLLRVGGAGGYLGVLRALADCVSRPCVRRGEPRSLGGLGEFGPWFWERVAVAEGERIDLLRRLLPADGAPGSGHVPPQGRYLDAVARRLEAAPRTVQPMLCQWFDDERPLPAADDAAVRPTVAGVAQALLYARRELAIDDLTEALVDGAHPRAAELLTALAEDEPSALCRAVDRWAHDGERPERRVAAALHGLAAAPHVTTGADCELLRYAALSLLARPGDSTLHGPALGLLVRDPETRSRYLDRALAAFGGDGSRPPAATLAAALTTHPEPVLAAFQARLEGGDADGEVLRVLADVRTPALARRAAALVRAYADRHPEGGAAHTAAYVDRRLEHGPAARAVLFPLVTGLLRDHPGPLRRALAPVLAAPGSRASRPLRAELLDVLLEGEQYGGYGEHQVRDPGVLEAVLLAAGTGARRRGEARTRDLVHRTGMLLVRTPEGATRFDRLLVGLAREVPGFAALVAGWLAAAPDEWAAVVGPSARRTVGSLATAMPMRAAPRGHGSLRPA